jgi:hypothetical protein
MKPSDSDRDQSHANWMQSMNEAHTTCRQVLMQASVDVSDPRRALWPAVPRRFMTQEHQTVAQCHAAVLDYAEHIEPFKNRCADLWTKQIEPPHEFPDGETLPVVLSELERWADRRYALQVQTEHELTGQQQDNEFRRVHIPTAYARECFRKLNDCRERLKLTADPPTQEETVGGPEDAW